MISNLDVRLALRSVLVGAIQAAALGLTASQVAWESRAFKEIDAMFVVEHLVPVDALSAATNLHGGSGLYQLAANGVKGMGTEAVEGLAAQLQALYPPGAKVWHGTAEVVVEESKTAAGFEDKGRWVIPVRVHYRQFNI